MSNLKFDLLFVMADCNGNIEKVQGRIDRLLADAQRSLDLMALTIEEYKKRAPEESAHDSEKCTYCASGTFCPWVSRRPAETTKKDCAFSNCQHPDHRPIRTRR